LPRWRRTAGAIEAAYIGPHATWASRGTNSVRGWLTGMSAMRSWRGTAASLPALDHRENSPAPGNQGMVAMTSSSQRRASAANC